MVLRLLAREVGKRATSQLTGLRSLSLDTDDTGHEDRGAASCAFSIVQTDGAHGLPLPAVVSLCTVLLERRWWPAGRIRQLTLPRNFG